MASSDNLVWLDMEMSGLDPEIDRILEIATIVTDSDLNEIAEGPLIAVHQSDAVLNNMDEWNTEHHTDSGLVARVRASTIDEKEAEDIVLEFLSQHVERGSSPLCGNSIAQDRRFAIRYLPRFDDYLHYRNMDVSTIKELVRRWRPDLYTGFKKKNDHRALEDVRESIAELRFYRDNFFKL